MLWKQSGSDEDLLVQIYSVTCGRRHTAPHTSRPFEFPWPKTVSWKGGFTVTPGSEHGVCLRYSGGFWVMQG